MTTLTPRRVFGQLQEAMERTDKIVANSYLSTIACAAMEMGNDKVQSIADKALDGFASDKMLWVLSYFVVNNNVQIHS